MPCPQLTYQRPEDIAPLLEKLKGRENPDQAVESRVREILARVASEGDEALADYTRRFDCPSFTASMLRVPRQDFERAMAEVSGADLEIIEEATANIRRFHENQRQKSWMTTSEDGTVLGQLVRPVDSVGLYVRGGEGGESPLISSLLMNAIPARVAGVERIAVGNPDSVPAGRYTRQSLTQAGLYDALKAKYVLASSVRQVLDYVSRGEVQAGFVYKTDALVAKDKVKIVGEMAGHSPITYPIAALAASSKKAEAKKYMDFLNTPEAQAVLAKYGFAKP